MAPHLTTLLDNAALARLERLRLVLRRRFPSRHGGEHLVGRSGTSTEFSDYRDYTEGDDVRFVDWNAFARLRRPYLKLYEDEEALHVVLLVDISGSMGIDGKARCACGLAAGLGVAALCGGERLSVYAFGAREPGIRRLGPLAGRGCLPRLFRFLESPAGEGDVILDEAIGQLLRLHGGRGATLVISDFLTPNSLGESLGRLYAAGQELMAVQVLGPSEIEPDLDRDVRLVDAETGRTMDVSATAELLRVYHEYRESVTREVERLCRLRGGRFLLVRSDSAPEGVFFERMRRGGWLR
jgi:uncharacterized protein (DUF58 family)